MKKEVLLAVIFGIIVGLAVTFGVYTANKAVQRQREKNIVQPPSEQTGLTDLQKKSGIEIYTPLDGLISTEDTIELSAAADPGATVVVLVNEDEFLTTVDDKGKFALELPLEPGSNVITIIVTKANGEQEQDQRVVVFSTANLDEVSSASSSASPKPTPKG